MKRRVRIGRPLVAKLAIIAMVGGVVAVSASSASAATATVGNGLTTTDLAAVGVTPASLASALVGAGVTVSNVTYSGANAQAGLIHVVDPAVVSFNDGIILSSGNIADVVGPNKSDSTTGDMAGPDDADLNALIANTQTVNPITFDRASLEFDFVPTANQVYFTYTFGSDEYLEWVNLFNDVFAFFVNGQNCATVPGGSTPVTIDTINSSVNPNLFRDNSFSSPPANPINIEPDGLSVEMICSAPVHAGQVNHMKLAIADTSDQVLDSVVMIKANSLSTTKPESCNDGVDNNDDTLIDSSDPICQATTTPPPVGGGGIGSSGNAPAFTGNEGTPIGLDAAAINWTLSSDTINTTWTVDGINGTVGSCDVSPAGPQSVIAGVIPVVTAICPNEGEYVAHVFGWDVEGKGSDDKDVDFFVHNAPPAVTVDTPAQNAQVALGSAVDVSATVTDPGVNDTLTCEINWGDGLTETGTLSAGVCSGSHTYASSGSEVIAVTATDDAGDSAAGAVVVDVVDVTDVAPVVTEDPVDQTVVAGGAVALTAAASGQPSPTVQWQSSTDGGATFADIPGEVSSTLGFDAVATDDGHQFRAVFTNAAGAATTASAMLTVNVAPTVTTDPLDETVTAGQTASFVAWATGQPSPTVQWQSSTDGGATFADMVGETANSLSFAAAAGDNGRQFRAVFTNAAGAATTAAATLTVDVAPSITTQPANRTVIAGATATFTAAASGQPSPTVQWQSSSNGGATFADMAGQTAGTLNVVTVAADTGRQFRAVFTNAAGTATTAAATLTVTTPTALPATKTKLTSSGSPSGYGVPVLFMAKVASVSGGLGIPTGTVTFKVDGAAQPPAPVIFGYAFLIRWPMSVGSHTVTATYNGSASFAASPTVSFVQKVIR